MFNHILSLSIQVTFNPNVEVVKMCTWNYAYWAARKADWTQIVVDRERFQNRINQVSTIISPVFCEKHRQKTLEKLEKGCNHTTNNECNR